MQHSCTPQECSCIHAIEKPQPGEQRQRRQKRTRAVRHHLLKNVTPYENEADYQTDLQNILKRDYGIHLEGKALQEAATNLDQLLTTYL